LFKTFIVCKRFEFSYFFTQLKSDLFRVRVEIKALTALQHENIAKLLQVIETKDEIYLILEVFRYYLLNIWFNSKPNVNEIVLQWRRTL
jgi:hypothetical protein